MSKTIELWGSGYFGAGAQNPWGRVGEKSKKAILTALYFKGPMTCKQLSEELNLATSTISRHIASLLEVDVIREVKYADKTYKVEKYYDLNFPVFMDNDHKVMSTAFEPIMKEIAETIERYIPELKATFEKCSLKEKGWRFEDPEVTFYLVTALEYAANEYLMEKGIFPRYKRRPGGLDWFIFGETSEELLPLKLQQHS